LNPWEQPESKVDGQMIDFDMGGGGESDFMRFNMKLQNKKKEDDVSSTNGRYL